jgi:carbamoyl-phosphate synthase large subunit
VLVEECLLGWKEFEMEVMRDHKDQCVVICSIENFDPMGVHTGDSITVAPAMTLTDKEYQAMRDASFAVIREIGVETGGSNIQFAVDPADRAHGRDRDEPARVALLALASKATGFPIAKIAAKLAVGYSLDELRNDITAAHPASFEPTIDYVVTKIPRFTFEKFPDADPTLTSSMKSVGEAMAIGRTFKESIQKALRSLEIGARGFGGGGKAWRRREARRRHDQDEARHPERRADLLHPLRLKAGYTVDQIFDLTKIDPWFLHHLREIHEMEDAPRGQTLADARHGTPAPGQAVRVLRRPAGPPARERPGRRPRGPQASRGIHTTFRLVDTCAAEFEAFTPYYYSSYGDENEVMPSSKRKIMILGGGPNRIGQGIEFDYCCVHASFALREIGFETVMVNSNPETVSTDYDTSDRLYFEPLTLEDVLEVYHQEGCEGAIVQFGGQTPLNLASALKANGVNIIGTSPESIEVAEDRKLFAAVLNKVGLLQPANRTALSEGEAEAFALEVGYPVLLQARPSSSAGAACSSSTARRT